MAVVALVIPDGDYTPYQERNPQEPEAALVATLRRFKHLNPGEGLMVLDEPTLKELRAALGQFETPKELARTIKRGGQIALKGASSGVYVPLSMIQKKRIREEADTKGLTETQVLQATMKEAVAMRYGPF